MNTQPIIERYYPLTDKRCKYDFSQPLDILRWVVRERFAWPGGYELFLVMTDGGIVCQSCARAEYETIYRDTRDDMRCGWTIAGYDATCNVDGSLICDHCNRDLLEILPEHNTELE